MENENELEYKILDGNEDKYFKLDFPEQKLEGNKKFEEFKKRKLEEYGSDAKLFKCKYDNIYYLEKCPLCRRYICYFCGSTYIIALEFFINCCYKRKLKYLFNVGGFKYFKELKELNKIEKEDFFVILKISLIPLIGIGFFIGITFIGLFYYMKLKDKELKKIIYSNRRHYYYYEYFEEYYSYKFLVVITVLIGFMLSVCYTIYDIYFKIILVFISLFSKFYPLKYYLGILSDGVKG